MNTFYLFSILATAAIFTLLALSLNIITGYAGQAMMGIAAFFGIGAYTAAIITTHGGNFFLALLAAMIVSAAFGAILGVISLRLQADFLAITTIGINFVMEAVFNRMKITGGIYAHRMGFISASDFAFVVSIQVVSMVVIGGLGTIRGPIFGALLITSLPEILRFAKDYRELVYGLLLVLMVRFMPQGLIGEDSPLWNALTKLWRKLFPKKKTRADLIVESVKGGEQA